MALNPRQQAFYEASTRSPKKVDHPQNPQGEQLRITQYFAQNIFDLQKTQSLSGEQKEQIQKVIKQNQTLDLELANAVAKAVTEWALSKGVTHFCHWFQPLTGETAEKHDSFLDFEGARPIERLSGKQLVMGEPDASSFPNGGSRSTFEARGYTSWDITSPMFVVENPSGKTLCIPSAFVSYHGAALDMKTPLLRSLKTIDEALSEFCNLVRPEGEKEIESVDVTCGTEQEYFLVDKLFYNQRADLVMSGRTLYGSLTARHQQLEDHYFGMIPTRVEAFMQDLEIELYKLGIPAKTRHNEVAPGQFELAPIFQKANIMADHNQLIMNTIKRIADEHNFVALLHEKPFAGVNGSGKHLNWSFSTDSGQNLLGPGDSPQENYRFLAVVGMILEAVKRHGGFLRASIASHGNDHRLGANEAPPSIFSIFLGTTLTQIFEKLVKGDQYTPSGEENLDHGTGAIVTLPKDNTDRNRTSPFAFTGNKFEIRALGSSSAVGFPMAIINAALAEVVTEYNGWIKEQKEAGKTADETLIALAKKCYESAESIVFNGDNYTQEWVQEAERRGLPNLKNTPEALALFRSEEKAKFLVEQGVFSYDELKLRHNVLVERYNKHRSVEFETLLASIYQGIIPCALEYKEELQTLIFNDRDLEMDSPFENRLYEEINRHLTAANEKIIALEKELSRAQEQDDVAFGETIVEKLLPLSEELAVHCNYFESVVPDKYWTLPKYYDLLFIR